MPHMPWWPHNPALSYVLAMATMHMAYMAFSDVLIRQKSCCPIPFQKQRKDLS